MDRKIRFYDLNTGLNIGHIADKSRGQGTPMSLAYLSAGSDTQEALIAGHDTGALSVYRCSKNWQLCDGRVAGYTIASHGFSAKSTLHKHT